MSPLARLPSTLELSDSPTPCLVNTSFSSATRMSLVTSSSKDQGEESSALTELICTRMSHYRHTSAAAIGFRQQPGTGTVGDPFESMAVYMLSLALEPILHA